MGLLWCSRLECQCSTPTLLVPHHCSQSRQSCPSLRHSGIHAPQPHTAKHHTNGLHCPRRDHTHMHLTRRTHHWIYQSTCSNTSAPPGHPTMGQTNTAHSEGYQSSTYVHKNFFNAAPNAPSNQRRTPRLTSKGGHPEA